MTITIIPETITDPKDVILTADGYELQEAVIERYLDDGEVPGAVYLEDQNGDQHEIQIDFISHLEKCTLDTLVEVTEEDRWEDVRPIVEAILWMPEDWLKTAHDLEIV